MMATRFKVPCKEPKPFFKNFTDQRLQIFITNFGLNQTLANFAEVSEESELLAFHNAKGNNTEGRRVMLMN